MNQKILFVINPVAGGKAVNKPALLAQIKNNLPAEIPFEIKIWETLNQADEIEDMILSSNYSLVVAVGGDGTVNFIAGVAMKKNIPMGIIPSGSGNGLARHLGIPLKIREAVKTLYAGKETAIDTGLVNGRLFLCTVGAGFDAHIGALFSKSTARGFYTYAKMSFSEFMRYKCREYTISFHDQSITRQAFILAIANVNQYGNNTYIAPQADLHDGKLDICIVKPFKIYDTPELAIRVFNKTLTKFRLYEYYKADKIILKVPEGEIVQYDGEPADLGSELLIEVKPARLKIMVP